MLPLIAYIAAGLPPCWGNRVLAASDRIIWQSDEGMATAEYAIVTLAAVAFAGLLLAIMRSGELRDALLGILKSALAVE